MALLYQGNASGDVPSEEFRCTTSALGVHDDILECPRCGLLSSKPTLTRDEILEGYEQVVDEEYLTEEGERRELFAWIADRIASFSHGGTRLYEVGANVGLFLSVAAERGWDVSGVEPSSWAVAQGRERFGVDLQEGTAETVELEPSSVDVLVMLDVLEHLNDPAAALRTLRPAVKDDGMLVLSTVNVASLHGRVRGGRWPWFIRSHLHYFRPPTLVAMLRDAGFDVVEWKVVPRSFHVSYLLHRAAGTFPGSSAVQRVARLADPKIPVGWIGDVTMVVARPRPS
jgi:2-polyprenyl-3-methyl-5-hydroxy-6-metoxy-1,4-benzoquinol methylase